MALATTCPQCMTSFRVVPDQLKLRRGLVRCGVCRNTFSGVDYLRYVDDAQVRGSRGTSLEPEVPVTPEEVHTALFVPASLVAAPEEAPLSEDRDDRNDGADRDDRNAVGLEAAVGTDAVDPFPDALTDEQTLADEALAELEHRTEEESPANEPGSRDWPSGEDSDEVGDEDSDAVGDEDSDAVDEADGHADDVQYDADSIEPADEATDLEAEVQAEVEAGDRAADGSPPDAYEAAAEPEALAREEAIADTGAEPSPGQAAVSRQVASPDRDGEADESAIDYFSRRRGAGFVDRHGALGVLVAFVLVAALVVQWVVAQRSEIAARVPVLAPAIAAVLAPFGLPLDPPRQLDSLTIESFELRASGTPDVLEMSALLRNRAAYLVQWPSMQLTLTDPANRVLVRKVIGPEEYLRDSEATLPQGVPPHGEWPLRLALEARDLQPAGYTVLLFYP